MKPNANESACESCQQATFRMCKRCGQRICRKCATNHQIRNYENPPEMQDIGKCVPPRQRRRGNEDSYIEEYNAQIDKHPNPQLVALEAERQGKGEKL